MKKHLYTNLYNDYKGQQGLEIEVDIRFSNVYDRPKKIMQCNNQFNI